MSQAERKEEDNDRCLVLPAVRDVIAWVLIGEMGPCPEIANSFQKQFDGDGTRKRTKI